MAKRIYPETMHEILEGINKIVVDSSRSGEQDVLFYLPLPELQKGGARSRQ